MEAMKTVKGWVREFIDVAILFIAVGVVAQIIFGAEVPFFAGITQNLMEFIKSLGSNGVVGLIALFVIVWVFTKNKITTTATNNNTTGN
jgi:H+/gluconate symporter-like permease